MATVFKPALGAITYQIIWGNAGSAVAILRTRDWLSDWANVNCVCSGHNILLATHHMQRHLSKNIKLYIPSIILMCPLYAIDKAPPP